MQADAIALAVFHQRDIAIAVCQRGDGQQYLAAGPLHPLQRGGQIRPAIQINAGNPGRRPAGAGWP